MHGSNAFSAPRSTGAQRRLVLGTALALALVVWLLPRTPAADAQESRPAASATAAVSGAASPTPPAESAGVAAESAAAAPEAAATDAKGRQRADAVVKDEKDPVTGRRSITVTKDGKTVTVTGAPGDREFDSFGEMVHTEPALAIMIIAVVAVVFLAPVLAIALILGYRMRKVRMQNETVLKLAEKGIVAPAEAIAAVATGAMPIPDEAGAAARATGVGAAVERAQQMRTRAAWSDLRKGIVMGAIGLGLTFYSIFEDRSPNGLGLVLLFVGIGYVVLWWFEQRQIALRGGEGSAPGSGPGTRL